MTRHHVLFLQCVTIASLLLTASLGYVAWTVACGFLYLASLLAYYAG